MSRTGLIVGKFYPPTLGHFHLIGKALEQVDKLIVLICVSDAETISGNDRWKILSGHWPTVDFRIVRDNVPVDYYSSEIWHRHLEIFEKAVPEVIDTIFTSEGYGQTMATYWSERNSYYVNHVGIDFSRHAVPISATKVRADPRSNWEQLPGLTKALLAKRIVVLGAESSGTTTLTKALAEEFDTHWVTEYGRVYADSLPENYSWGCKDFSHITIQQSAMEDGLAAWSRGGLLFCDTDAFTTSIFEQFYLGNSAPSIRQYGESRVPALYLHTSPDGVPAEDDGSRTLLARREEFATETRKRLANQPAPWVEVTGTPEERLTQAAEAVSVVLKTGWSFGPTLG